MAKVAFRFDIDSHKCIRDGVPVLLELSNRYSIPFTFYVNVGRAVSIMDTMHSIRKKKESSEEHFQMLSARQKLGIKDYIYAAVVNPMLGNYKKNILAIAQSGCELGLHGGMNHSHWHMHALNWSYSQIKCDLEKALRIMRSILPEYKPQGFAAPGFVANAAIEQVLQDMGFEYSSNWHENNTFKIRRLKNDFPCLGVNLCGEPGGIAFWEYATASGWSDKQALEKFMNMVNSHDEVVVFDHPYFVAMQKAKLLEETICCVMEQGHQVVTMKELALNGNEILF